MEIKKLREELEANIVNRALKDEKFMQQLIVNPKSCIESELGISLPVSLKITVLEEKTDEIYLVLPAFHSPGTELSETELESVAGGWSDYPDCSYWCPD
jgi:hypothetical protein